MGSKPTKPKAPVTLQKPSKKHRLSQSKQSKQHQSSASYGICASNTFDVNDTPPTTNRAGNQSRLQFTGKFTQESPVAKIDVSASHRRIKKQSHVKLDVNQVKASETVNPLISSRVKVKNSRSELVADAFFLDPLVYTDPYDRFATEPFDRHPANRPAARTSRLVLFKSQGSSSFVNETEVDLFRATTYTDLMAQIKLRQKAGGGLGAVKESLLAKHKAGQATKPGLKANPGEAKPLAKYWIKYKQEGRLASKTEDAGDKAKNLKPRNEMSRRWKGKLGTLLTK
jgi:hypothetical protein